MKLISDLRFWVSLAVFLSISLVLGFAYTRYETTLRENAQLKQNVASLTSAVEEQRKSTAYALQAIDEWKLSQEKMAHELEDYRRNQAASGKRLEKLNELFAKHNLELLARKKPLAIQRRANAATAAFYGLLGCETDPDRSCRASSGASQDSTATRP